MAAIVIAAAFHFDYTMQNFIAQHQGRLANKVMHKISHFGDWPEHFALGLVLASIAWWRGSKKWKRVFLAILIAWARNQACHRPCKTLCEVGRSLERPPPWFKISCVPVRSRRGIQRVFRRLIFCELADRSRLSAHPTCDRSLAHVRRGTLFIGCRLRCAARRTVRLRRHAFFCCFGLDQNEQRNSVEAAVSAA